MNLPVVLLSCLLGQATATFNVLQHLGLSPQEDVEPISHPLGIGTVGLHFGGTSPGTFGSIGLGGYSPSLNGVNQGYVAGPPLSIVGGNYNTAASSAAASSAAYNQGLSNNVYSSAQSASRGLGGNIGTVSSLNGVNQGYVAGPPLSTFGGNYNNAVSSAAASSAAYNQGLSNNVYSSAQSASRGLGGSVGTASSLTGVNQGYVVSPPVPTIGANYNTASAASAVYNPGSSNNVYTSAQSASRGLGGSIGTASSLTGVNQGYVASQLAPGIGGNYNTASAASAVYNQGSSNNAYASAQSASRGFGGSNAIASSASAARTFGVNQYSPANTYGVPTY